jgi:hypothetical protein
VTLIVESKRKWVVSLVPILLALAACRFGSEGSPLPIDGAADLPTEHADLASSDLPPEDLPPGGDGGSDLAAADAETICLGEPAGPRCRFGAGDPVGFSGRCDGEVLVVGRACYEDAPCAADYGCSMAAVQCQACDWDGDCSGTCTVLFVPFEGARRCCVGRSRNGIGGLGVPCSGGLNCRSGLCTSSGRCFVPCREDEQCGEGLCRPLRIRLAGVEYAQLGCVEAAPDAGPDGGDAAPGDGGPADGGPADAGSTDGGPADGGPADGGPADGGPADGGPDLGGDGRVDAT